MAIVRGLSERDGTDSHFPKTQCELQILLSLASITLYSHSTIFSFFDEKVVEITAFIFPNEFLIFTPLA